MAIGDDDIVGLRPEGTGEAEAEIRAMSGLYHLRIFSALTVSAFAFGAVNAEQHTVHFINKLRLRLCPFS